MENIIISRRLRKRLPLYLEYLNRLPEDSSNVSATSIAKALDMGHVLVRKDLAKVSEAGRCKTGRNRQQLIQDITEYLNFAKQTGTIVVGAGESGQSLLDHTGFAEAGLNVMAGFHIAPGAEQSEDGKPIFPLDRMESFCKHYDVHVGVLAAEEDSAQQLCDALIACGIRTILNFTPIPLQVPKYVHVQNEEHTGFLTSLQSQLKRQLEEANAERDSIPNR